MNKKIRLILYGFLIWFIPALVAILVWDMETNLPIMGMTWFNSTMAVVWSLNFALVAFFYFKAINKNYIKEGLIAGISWYIICVLLDLIILVGIFKTDMSTWYPGLLSYLNNFFIATGIGFILNKNIKKR
ncbi:MAG: hypothetical protein OQK82_02445 [Candidatus Pacearchaeota archaeon]|nr:hypothetical protein [Candidatus Pacearchaeota archaeon]